MRWRWNYFKASSLPWLRYEHVLRSLWRCNVESVNLLWSWESLLCFKAWNVFIKSWKSSGWSLSTFPQKQCELRDELNFQSHYLLLRSPFSSFRRRNFILEITKAALSQIIIIVALLALISRKTFCWWWWNNFWFLLSSGKRRIIPSVAR